MSRPGGGAPTERYSTAAERLRFSGIGALLALLLVSRSVADTAPVHVIEIDGVITPAITEFIKKSVQRAEAEQAACLIVILDTPGGLVSSTQNIVKEILNAPVPVVVFVYPAGAHAASAGTFITASANIAAMAPGTRLGAATPVGGQGGDIEGDLGKKVLKDTLAWMESIAKQRGRNVEWLKKAVAEAESVTSERALELEVIDVVATDLDDLLVKIDGWEAEVVGGVKVTLATRGAEKRFFAMSTIDRIIQTIAHPNIAVLLMMGGMLGLYVEFTNPGVIFPGVAGALCLVLAFISLEILTFNVGGLLLTLLGVGLLVAEIFVASFGLLFVSGTVALSLGLMLMFDTPESDLRPDFWRVIFPMVAALAIFGGFIAYKVTRAQFGPSATGVEALLRERGEVRGDIEPGRKGKVWIHGEYWNAVSNETIRAGETVRIEKVDNMLLRVARLKEGE